MMNWMINWNAEADRYAGSMDLTVVIGGQGALYPCPNTSAVDRHIVRLYKQIEDTGPDHVQGLWADIDLLLERRMFLGLDLQVSDAA
jgi:hypothetical protein